jgi:hypothetical protein
LAYVPKTNDGRWCGRSTGRAILATLSLALLTWSLTAASEVGVYAGLAMLGVFLWLEAKRGSGRSCRSRRSRRDLHRAELLTFFLYASLGGLLVLLPYLLIRIEGYSAVAAGAGMLPLCSS